MKKSWFLGIVIAAFCCFFGMAAYVMYSPTIEEEGGQVFNVYPGMGKKTFIKELAARNILHHSLMFTLYTYPQKSTSLKAGEYFFPKGASLYSIWQQVTHGTGQKQHEFTIVPGWTFTQVRQQLSRTEGLVPLTAELTNKQIMERLGHPELDAEGEFFPETYYFAKGMSDLVILQRAFKLMQSRLDEAWEQRIKDLPYADKYAALIAASLIEKEAYHNTERPLIAGVLVNRLRENMLLQFDPTIIYGLGANYKGKIYKEDLTFDTPYNTYLHKGLPPTPIAMPGEASLKAATQPAVHDYYYFVAHGNKEHQFSKNLTDHNVAVFAAHQQTTNEFFNDSKINQSVDLAVSEAINRFTQQPTLSTNH